MSSNRKIFYQPRTMSPKERVMMLNLRAENEELKQLVAKQAEELNIFTNTIMGDLDQTKEENDYE